MPIGQAEPDIRRQRTQQETSLLSLINPTLAASLDKAQESGVQPIEENNLNEEEDADDDVEIATDSEEGELDIPKPLPKMLTPAQRKKKERKNRVLAKDRGPVLQTISLDDVKPHQSNVTWDQDPELLCSYNWSSTVDSNNTIYVPGGPSKWTPQNVPYKVPGDGGFHPTDYNYVRQPRDPFSAVFQALTVMNPDYAFNDIDILADRNNLRVLLEFVQGKAVGPFRLDLYMVFGTLIIVRREDGFWRYSNGTGYGFNFEKHFTTNTPDMADATSHYRAIRYRMGPLNVVCRFEADAYVDTAADTLSSEANTTIPPTPTSPDLLQRPIFSWRAPFRVLQQGHLVPGSQILELKTQAQKPPEYNQSLVSCQDQLWFGRTTHLYTGRYEPGTGRVLHIKHEDATERIKRWEDKNQEDLQKLVGLLMMLKGTLMRQKTLRAAILVREDPRGPVTLHHMLDKPYVVQRQFFERHWMRNAKPKPYAQNAGRGQQHPGRGRGQPGAQRGQQAQRGQAGPQRAYRPLGERQSPPRQHRPEPNHGQLNNSGPPVPRSDAPQRGGRGHRGRGNAARRARGNAEQTQN